MAKNIIEVSPEKFPWLDPSRYTFAMGVEKNGTLYLAGQTASTYYKGEGVLCKGDILEQTKVVMEKLGVVLDAAGMSFDDVVKTVDYINPQGLAKYKHTAAIRRQYLGDGPVASTGICVDSLLRPDALIEINAIAVKGGKERILPAGAEFDRYKQLTFAPAVKSGKTVWLSGVIGFQRDSEGNRVYSQDTATQVEHAYAEMGATLKTAGATPKDVVQSIDYIAPQALLQYRNTGKVRKEFFSGTYPTATGIQVNRLLRPTGHVEIELTAVIDTPREEIRIPSWEKRYEQLTYVPALKVGNQVYFSGQGSVDHSSGQSVVADMDVVAQARRAYQNIAETCAAAGISMDDIVNTIEFMPPNAVEGYRGVGQVRREIFGDRFPAATGVLMHNLLRPELMFEVVAVALV